MSAPAIKRDDAVAAAYHDEVLAHPEADPPPAPVVAPDRAQVVDPETWWPNPGEDPVASYAQVTVSYDDRPAVADVSLPVPRGAIVGLIGPPGAGKSTLLRCLNRLNDLIPAARIEGDVR